MIGSKTLAVNPFEKASLLAGVYLQLTLKVKPNQVNEIVNEISKKAVGCRTLFDGEKYVYTPEKCPIFKIPDNFPNLEETHLYVSKHHTIPESQRLASICYNHDTVVLNTNHAASDGGYLKMLTNYLSGHETPKDPHYYLFESLNDIYAEKFKKVKLEDWDQSSTKVRSQHLKQDKVTAYYAPIEVPLNHTVNYINGRCKGMTDLLWSSMILSISAYNGEFTNAKICNATDGRREIENPDWRHVNVNSVVSLEAKNLTQFDTIGEMGRRLRRDLQRKLESSAVLSSLKGFAEGASFASLDYPSICLSNIGILKTGNAITDANISVSVKYQSPEPGSLILHCNCVDDKVFRGRVYCSPCVMKEKDNYAVGAAISHCMTHFNNDMIIKDAIQELRSKFSF